MKEPSALRWSSPDSQGILTCVLDKAHLHRKRKAACWDQPDRSIAWPPDSLGLLREWLSGKTQRRYWKTLLETAGATRVELARDLVQTLLEGGWIALNQRRARDRWVDQYIEWHCVDDLRELAGLSRFDALAMARQDALQASVVNRALTSLCLSLESVASSSLARRAKLVSSLDCWITEQRSGTRRQFALHALGDTKAVTSADWKWLCDHVELEAHGITKHAPALWLRAPLALCSGGRVLDLRVIPDLVGLSPETLANIETVSGDIDAWLVLENRTSFEEVAKQWGGNVGVIWVPGFAPTWWLLCVSHILKLLPRPAWISADPDPAGIEIAVRAAKPWQDRGLAWQPWSMDPTALDELRQHKPLTAHDRDRLANLDAFPLPNALKELADTMLRLNIKGEQEGLALVHRLPSHLVRDRP